MLSAFIPIAPRAALSLAEEAGFADVARVLSDFAVAGLLKSYARVIETIDGSGQRTEVRDSRIPRDIWRRIVAQEVVEDAWATGSARLAGSDLLGGAPRLTVIGIRFDDKSLLTVLDQHRPLAPPAKRVAAAPCPKPVLPPAEPETNVETASPHVIAKSSGIPDGAISVSVAQAGAALGLGRTKINAMMKTGELSRIKAGGRTLITVDSIRALARTGSVSS